MISDLTVRHYGEQDSESPDKGEWTYVVMPGSAEYFGTHGLVKVRDTTVRFEKRVA